MTTAHERANAVIGTREFLETLALTGTTYAVSDLRRIAERLLRHYPLDVDLAVSATALPSLWVEPDRSMPHGIMSRKSFSARKREPQ
ncbi:BPSL0761 family protein [Paraburkholderia sp.]|uniref:BPSL0761 family protein n=1 Tax=Paraburkholderia sp. TaxID=1926495 RepID=UPI00257E2781|nr:BPSL0761 family protein [Paraburkholderia sp.]